MSGLPRSSLLSSRHTRGPMPALAEESLPIVGDLSSLPNPDRRLWTDEIHALDQLIRMGAPPEQAAIFRDIIHDRRAILEQELREREFLTKMINAEVHFQLRARSDFAEAKIVVEQWVPAVNCWLISGKFDIDATPAYIIAELQKGDPRRTSAAEVFAAAKEAATAKRAARDAESSLKVLDAVNDLSAARLDEFIAVEEALKTGETITSRGDDRRTLDTLEARTRDAAAAGDSEAQSVLTHGVRDNVMCHNPGDNPLVR